MRQVTEEMKPQQEWFKEAKNIQSIEQLTAFAKVLFEDTQHDYGTVCHAIAALAIGAAWYGAHSQGITGFQAGFIMWDFIEQWEYSDNQCGLRIIDYDKMLYPQYEDKFEKVITSEQFKKMQEVAAEKLKGKDFAHPDVVKHWESIVSGTVPFSYKLVNRTDV
jgi:hypothetical protein